MKKNVQYSEERLGIVAVGAIVAVNMLSSRITFLPTSFACFSSISTVFWLLTFLVALVLISVFKYLGIINSQNEIIAFARKLFSIVGFPSGLLCLFGIWFGNIAILITGVEIYQKISDLFHFFNINLPFRFCDFGLRENRDCKYISDIIYLFYIVCA